MKVDRVIPCICCDHERDYGDSVYYGMPQLKVTDVHPVLKRQYFEAYCPNCGRGGCGFQYRSAYLALKHWNEMQEEIRAGYNIFKTDVDSPLQSP